MDEILVGQFDEYILDGTRFRKDVFSVRSRNTGRNFSELV
jgi:hypothetical protein